MYAVQFVVGFNWLYVPKYPEGMLSPFAPTVAKPKLLYTSPPGRVVVVVEVVVVVDVVGGMVVDVVVVDGRVVEVVVEDVVVVEVVEVVVGGTPDVLRCICRTPSDPKVHDKSMTPLAMV
jgi:hypothetical protein